MGRFGVEFGAECLVGKNKRSTFATPCEMDFGQKALG